MSNPAGLSNHLDPRPREQLAARQVAASEIHPALRVLMGNPSDAEMVDFLRLCMARQINLNEITVVVDAGGRIHWTILPVTHPGRSAMLFAPPAPVDQTHQWAAGQAVEEMAARLAGRGVELVQVLLEPQDAASRGVFESAGFTTISQLMYLQGAVRRRAIPPEMPDGLSWLTYSARTHGLFAHAIAQSYEGSLDCPALNGRRDIENIIAGHKSTGQFEPRHWMVLSGGGPAVGAAGDASILHGDRSVLGVLLLNRTPGTEVMELVYLGLVPVARGKRLGDLLVRQALATARSAGCANVALAVDAANEPALRLYHRYGFEHVSSRLVVVRDLRAGAPPLERMAQLPETSTHFPHVR